MGQRTLNLIECRKGDKVVRTAYHQQWGYGTAGARGCLGLLQTDYFDFPYGADFVKEMIQKMEKTRRPGFPLYYTNEEIQEHYLLPNGEVNMRRAIQDHDNNNGGIYLRLDFNEYSHVKGGEISFYRGPEDISHKSEYAGQKMSLREYFKLFDEEDKADTFIKMFHYEGVLAL